MRNWINILLEAETKVKDKTDTLAPSVSVDGSTDLAVAKDGSGSALTTPAGRTADGARTAAAVRDGMANVNVPADMMSDAMGLAAGQQDIISDEEARAAAGNHDAYAGVALPRTPETLPMIIQNDIVASGDETFDPEWHQVRHLPGYLMTGIRIVAREVFARFTTTPIEDIQMMCTILNPERDVRHMMGWIAANGQKEDEMTFDFSQYIRGYSAKIQIWRVSGFQFALCTDIGGVYIYGWPENNREVTDRSETEMKRLPGQ